MKEAFLNLAKSLNYTDSEIEALLNNNFEGKGGPLSRNPLGFD